MRAKLLGIGIVILTLVIGGYIASDSQYRLIAVPVKELPVVNFSAECETPYANHSEQRNFTQVNWQIETRTKDSFMSIMWLQLNDDGTVFAFHHTFPPRTKASIRTWESFEVWAVCAPTSGGIDDYLSLISEGYSKLGYHADSHVALKGATVTLREVASDGR